MPDDLSPFHLLNQEYRQNLDEGYLFFANFRWGDFLNSRSYLQIWDDTGDLVFYRQLPAVAVDFKKQPTGQLSYFNVATNRFELLDDSYNVVDSIVAGHGYPTDLHELLLLPNGHAILMIYDAQPVDMSQVVAGGNPSAIVEGLIVQELDAARNVIFEWRSWDHMQITDAIGIDLTAEMIDPIHGNSIEVDQDGNLLVSSRHIDEVTKIDRNSAEIIWRLGGKNNDFTFLNNAIPFRRQHDARRRPDGTISIFDNGSDVSRAVVYALDEANFTISEQFAVRQRLDAYALAMGNAQTLPNGNLLIGWGSGTPTLTEVWSNGNQFTALEMAMPAPQVSYRAFRFPWQGQPEAPRLVFASGNLLAFSSNGATDPDSHYFYEIYADDVLIGTRGRTGFEDNFAVDAHFATTERFHVVLKSTADPTLALTSNSVAQQPALYLPLLTTAGVPFAQRPTPPAFDAAQLWLQFENGAFVSEVGAGDAVTCAVAHCPQISAEGSDAYRL